MFFVYWMITLLLSTHFSIYLFRFLNDLSVIYLFSSIELMESISSLTQVSTALSIPSTKWLMSFIEFENEGKAIGRSTSSSYISDVPERLSWKDVSGFTIKLLFSSWGDSGVSTIFKGSVRHDLWMSSFIVSRAIEFFLLRNIQIPLWIMIRAQVSFSFHAASHRAIISLILFGDSSSANI